MVWVFRLLGVASRFEVWGLGFWRFWVAQEFGSVWISAVSDFKVFGSLGLFRGFGLFWFWVGGCLGSGLGFRVLDSVGFGSVSGFWTTWSGSGLLKSLDLFGF